MSSYLIRILEISRGDPETPGPPAVEIATTRLTARDVDDARRQAREYMASRLLPIRSMAFSASEERTLLVYTDPGQPQDGLPVPGSPHAVLSGGPGGWKSVGG